MRDLKELILELEQQVATAQQPQLQRIVPQKPVAVPKQAPTLPSQEGKPQGIIPKVASGIKNLAQKAVKKFAGPHSWLWKALQLQKSGELARAGIKIITPPGMNEIPREVFETLTGYKEHLKLVAEAQAAGMGQDADLEDKLKHDNPIYPNMKPSELLDELEFHFSQKKPIMIWGAPGIGKTDIISQLATKLGVPVILIDLSRMDPLDIGGLPVPSKAKKSDGEEMDVFTSAIADIWPRSNGPDGKGGIIFFDEFNNSSERTMNASHNLLLGSSIGKYKLPSQWVIFAAGNRHSDNPRVTPLSTPVSNRLAHVNLITDVEEFEKWATSEGGIDKAKEIEEDGRKFKVGTGLKKIDPSVLAFLKYRPNLLWDAKAGTSKEERYLLPSPRSWTNASFEMVYRQHASKNRLSENRITTIFAKYVGLPAAEEYAKFREVMSNVSFADIELIMSDPDSAPLPVLSDPSKEKGPDNQYTLDNMYAMLAVLLNSAHRNPTAEKFYNIVSWTTRLDEAEPAAYVVRNLNHSAPDEIKRDNRFAYDAMTKFYEKYGEQISIPDAKNLEKIRQESFKTIKDWLESFC